MKFLRRFFADPPLAGSRFRVQGLGLREWMPRSLIQRPQGTGDYLLMFFHTPVQAGCSPCAGMIPANSLFIWEPGDYQFYGNTHRRFLHSWLHCEGSAVARLGASGLRARQPLAVGSAGAFEKFLLDLYEEISSPFPTDEIIAENLLVNWTRVCARLVTPKTGRPPTRLTAVRDFIDSNFARPLSLPQLARMANWSPAHFSAEFRRHFGTPPMDYVIRQRLQHAVYLLRDVNRKVAEVAQLVGYEDIYHFSKLFKRHLGVSPRQMRR